MWLWCERDRSYLQVPGGDDFVYGLAGVLEPVSVRLHSPVGEQGKDVGNEELYDQARSLHYYYHRPICYLLN